METSLVTSIIVINAENNMPQWYRCEANNMYGTSLQYYKIVIWSEYSFFLFICYIKEYYFDPMNQDS